jgi:hypothetical protein
MTQAVAPPAKQFSARSVRTPATMQLSKILAQVSVRASLPCQFKCKEECRLGIWRGHQAPKHGSEPSNGSDEVRLPLLFGH